MRCPECGSACLRVEVTFTGTVDLNFGADEGYRVMQPVCLDSTLIAGADCGCLSCSWQGTVREAESFDD